MTEGELEEAILTLMGYAGHARAIEAIDIARGVFREGGLLESRFESLRELSRDSRTAHLAKQRSITKSRTLACMFHERQIATVQFELLLPLAVGSQTNRESAGTQHSRFSPGAIRSFAPARVIVVIFAVERPSGRCSPGAPP